MLRSLRQQRASPWQVLLAALSCSFYRQAQCTPPLLILSCASICGERGWSKVELGHLTPACIYKSEDPITRTSIQRGGSKRLCSRSWSRRQRRAHTRTHRGWGQQRWGLQSLRTFRPINRNVKNCSTLSACRALLGSTRTMCCPWPSQSTQQIAIPWQRTPEHIRMRREVPCGVQGVVQTSEVMLRGDLIWCK